MKPIWLAATMALLLTPSPVAAQAGGGRWWLGMRLARTGFDGASQDSTSPPTGPIQLRPQGRLDLGLTFTYSGTVWAGTIDASYAGGHVIATTSAGNIEDKTFALRRFQVAASLSRRLIRWGESELTLGAGPTLDRWSGSGLTSQVRIGGRGGLVLRIPVGGVRIENTVQVGWSGSPFSAEDLPSYVRRRDLWSFSAGIGIQLRL